MSNPIVGELTDTVKNTIGVVKSATVLIRGFKQRLADAVATAIANGATEEELKPLVDLETELETSEVDLAAAVAENQ